jgi:hypothetical protein
MKRIISKLLRTSAKIVGYRPSSAPYISGDSFRTIADHIYDETKKCRAEEVQEGSIVFLKADYINEWFEQIHPRIQTRYKLITHNGDGCVGEHEARYIDDKIIHWFAQNNTFRHDKITPIPIGLENSHWFMSGWTLIKMRARLRTIQKTKQGQNGRILFGFNEATNLVERSAALKALHISPQADEIKKRLGPCAYFKLLNGYSYVASPKGNGPDCHRTWEALYLGIIPITTHSTGLEYFVSLGLPIALIENWDTIDTVTSQHIQWSDHPALYFGFWKDIIMRP